jgi:hypothetical protein
MTPALFNNFYPYSFSWNTTWYEEHTPFISPYGVAPIGEICEFNVNAHVHLRIDLL